jgi:hypothetical protein
MLTDKILIFNFLNLTAMLLSCMSLKSYNRVYGV